MPTRAAPAERTTRVPFSQTPVSTPVLGLVGTLAFIVIWELASRLEVVNPLYLPPFSEVAVTVVQVVAGDLYRAQFWTALGNTMLGWSVGLAISLVLGIVVGLVIGSNHRVREFTHSTIEFLRPIPSVGLIPIAIVVFGVRPTATIAIVVWACFWVILIHVIYGVADVDPVAESTARSYGFGPLARARYVVWPTLLPYLMTGVRLSGTIALVVAVTIEIVVQAPGIGQMIAQYQSAGNSAVVYALALLAGVLGLIINLALRRLENSVLAWHPSVRGEVVP
ncbi:ABC transporter permease subunit [Cryobacterium sp. Hh7]|uniref:ABC transporter permease n=1 Tax=Cryobacterium sp. Hh7 TaxID=1259159 RepID=UPI00106BEF63|nr:ABC transporter permease subunit [Cryobacterium sp. Hh7]TFD59662.1 ABC transporter permease subunit [Cryobacterium sp. Hh7]